MASIFVEGTVDKELGSKSIGSLLWAYSLPTIIATVATSLYNIIDRVFIGQIVGPLAISGLTVTLPFMNICTALGMLVGSGAAAIISIRLGENKRNEAQFTLGNAVALNVAISLFVAIVGLLFIDEILTFFGASPLTLPYARSFMRIILIGNPVAQLFFCLNGIMRASCYPVKAMGAVLLTMVVNLLLVYLLIYRFGFGIEGAAIATVLGQTAGLVWVLVHFLGNQSHLRLQRLQFKVRWDISRHIFSIGLSPFLIHFSTCLVVAVCNWRLKDYGGDYAIGAYGVISTVVNLVVVVVLGLAQGMQPIVGYNYGARQFDRVVRALWMTICIGTGCTILGFLVMQFFPYQIAYCFTNDLILADLIRSGMRIYCILFPLVGFQVVVSNFFQSIGKPKVSIFLSISRQLLFWIPLVLVLPHFYGLDGVWYAMPAADLLSTLLTTVMLWYYYQKLTIEIQTKDIENEIVTTI